jgi:hypothetical protein
VHRCPTCRRRFQPLKSYYCCLWPCRQADAEDRGRSSPGDIWQHGYDANCRDGLHDGQAQARQHARMPLPIWPRLVKASHPDRYQGSELELITGEVTRWLLRHTPQEVHRG